MMDTGKIFAKLKDDVLSYVELRLEYLKLTTYEGISKLAATLSYGVILLLIGFVAAIFIFFALSYFIGELLGNIGAGFGAVAVLFLVILGCVMLCKNKIKSSISDTLIKTLTEPDEDTVPLKKDEDEHKQ